MAASALSAHQVKYGLATGERFRRRIVGLPIIRQKCQTQKRITRPIQCGNPQTCPIYHFILMAHFHLQGSQRTLCCNL